MTVRLDLPADLEERLMAEVRAGRHATVEEAILEKLNQSEDLSSAAIAELAGKDAAFEFLNDPREDLYNESDGEAV